MSKNATPSSAFMWLDCDAYRGKAGAPRPDLSDMSEGAAYEGFDAFGGMETGFSITSEGAATPKQVMNYRQAPYKVSRAPRVDTVTFRNVDTSKAYLDTITNGGRILEFPDGTVEIEVGTTEEFSLLLIAREGDEAGAYYSPRVTLSTPPTEGAVDGETLAGSEFSIIALEPLRKIYGERPEALKDGDVIKVDKTGKALAGSSVASPGAGA